MTTIIVVVIIIIIIIVILTVTTVVVFTFLYRRKFVTLEALKSCISRVHHCGIFMALLHNRQ